MDAHECAQRTKDAVGEVPARFMMDGGTYEHGATLGFEGIDFYFLGRGGALGDVDGPVVAAAFVFFNPATVEESWERGRKACAPGDAALAFAAAGHRWAESKLPDGVDYARLAELLGRVTDASSVAGAPLFAGWMGLPEPASAPALALHRLNALRELRGARHGAAVLAHGLTPTEALFVKTPFMSALFGWGEPTEPTPAHQAAWARAEEATDASMAPSFGVLSDTERAELVELLAPVLGR
ncbi:MAG TPA: hypothetical protein VKR22_06100 [Acidimicrobiales bacterium]|nr:hypothetical protein [Acidimicrobiales bacterium]